MVYTTTGTIRAFQGTLAGTWATGGNLNTTPGRFQLGGAGTQTAALAFGGGTQWPGVGVTANAETYNGSAWSEVGDLNAPRRNLSGLGTQTAALAVAGENPTTDTESWNGSGWTEVGDLNSGKNNSCGATGTNTAGIAFGGETTAGPGNVNAETWNGSSWTEVGNLNKGRYDIGGAGTSTSALAFGGTTPGTPPVDKDETESWNGTAWTELADLNTAREGHGGFGASNTSALCAAGTTTNTEEWNGTAWTEVADTSSALITTAATMSGTTSLGAIFGGYTGPGINPQVTTLEWTGPSDETVSFDAS